MTEPDQKQNNDKGPFLYDLEPNHRFMGYYMVKESQLEPFRDRSKGHYLSLRLADKSGDMLARVWENAEDTLVELDNAPVIKIDGETEEYQDRVQIRVYRIRPAKEAEYDLSDLLPSTPRDIKELTAIAINMLGQITDPFLRALVESFYNKDSTLTAIQKAPAAREIHHAYIGGLLEHTVECLIIAETLLQLYPAINTDLLYTGLLLHDIGKIREFNFDKGIEYSTEGRLVGHIAIGHSMVTEAIQKIEGFPAELAMQVQHLMLSHHGRYEWGSPRRPKTIEAAAIHYIDNLTAQVNRFANLAEGHSAGWSAYDRSLNRSIYSGRNTDLNIEETSQLE